jgi:hypothetical protein
MLVGELIAALQKFPENNEVMVYAEGVFHLLAPDCVQQDKEFPKIIFIDGDGETYWP